MERHTLGAPREDGATSFDVTGLPASVKRLEFNGSKALYTRLSKALPRLKVVYKPQLSGRIVVR